MRCYYCSLCKNSYRFFRDKREEPFVVVMDTRYMSPVLVLRKHRSIGDFAEAQRCFAAIHEQAQLLLGDMFVCRLEADCEHFYIRAEELFSTEEQEKV